MFKGSALVCRFSLLQKHTTDHIIDLREKCWQPLIYYRTSLLAVAEGDDALTPISPDGKHNRSPSSKQKLEGTLADDKRKQAPFMSPSTSCSVSLLTFSGRKSPGAFSPADSKVSKGQRSSFSPR